MQSRLTLPRSTTLLALALLALPAQAQNIDVEQVLTNECDAGDNSACVRLDLVRRLQRDEGGNITFAPRDSITPSTPRQTAEHPAHATAAPEVPIAPSDAASTVWKWIAIVLLGFFALFAYRMLKVGLEKKSPPVKTKPPLKRPPVLKGARSSQGDLIRDTDSTRQLIPWDTSEVKIWLKTAAEECRPMVQTPEVLTLCDNESTFIGDEGVPRFSAIRAAYGDNTGLNNTQAWASPEVRYATLKAASLGIVGSAYAIGLMLWETGEADHTTILALFRLDSDRDFNPSTVNLHGYLVTKNLQPRDYMGDDVLEAHLRQGFDIGAPDGHYHIATQLLSFYLWTCPDRPDEGYVAAALRRVQSYSTFDARTYIDRIEEWPEAWDIDDKSVSTNGMMYEQHAASAGPMQ